MVPPESFQSFRAELASLRALVGNMRKKTLRDETTRERFRTLYRVWISVVTPAVRPLLSNRRDFAKLTGEIEALAVLTGRIKPVDEYRKRLNRAIQLANDLELYLPPIATLEQVAPPHRVLRTYLSRGFQTFQRLLCRMLSLVGEATLQHSSKSIPLIGPCS